MGGSCLRRTCEGHTPEGPLGRLPSPRLRRVASSLIYSGDRESGVRETYRARLLEYLSNAWATKPALLL